jgi:hypothetical protein
MKSGAWGIAYLSLSGRADAAPPVADDAELAPVRPEAWAAWAKKNGAGPIATTTDVGKVAVGAGPAQPATAEAGHPARPRRAPARGW